MSGKSGKTSRAAREAYNQRNYVRYSFRVRNDSGLHEDIEAFMAKGGTSLSYLVTKLLSEYFLREEPDSTV